MTQTETIAFILFAVVCLATAATASRFRPGAWYATLAKPRWRPPNWLFGPVWAVLYAVIALAGWLIWRTDDPLRELALILYVLQLGLNAAWSPVFFGLKRPDLGLAIMIALWIAILATIAVFHRVFPLAAFMLVPYALWVSFAALLNLRIVQLNPGRAGQSD